MQELRINQTEWKSFFDAFSKRNQSRLVSVEIFNEFGAQKEVKKMPLSGIVYENGKKNSSFLEIMFENRRTEGGNHLTHFIPNVQNVFPKKYDDGCDEALEIEDSEGNKTLLVFERLPELKAGAYCMAAGAGLWK
jgi:hypothetical protein